MAFIIRIYHDAGPLNVTFYKYFCLKGKMYCYKRLLGDWQQMYCYTRLLGDWQQMYCYTRLLGDWQQMYCYTRLLGDWQQMKFTKHILWVLVCNL